MIIEKVVHMIEKYNMINAGDGVVVGFSGGPDSVCLLHALHSLKQKYNFELYAVHLNHMIRGEEATRDENFARKFAEALNIPFYSKRIKVESYAKENGLSSEEAGRFLRYELFETVLRSVGGNKIALAHNMNDQAETMIMRFIRGTGISGMGGIRPVRNNKFIRPILSCNRAEIENYCEIHLLNPVIDSTNEKSIYTRNKVRLEVLPYIKEHFNPNITENLFRVSEIMRDEDDYLNLIADRELKTIRTSKGISREAFISFHIALKRRVIRILIEEIKGDLTGIESKHIEECINFIETTGTGKSINLPKQIECIIEYGFFKINEKNILCDYEYKIVIPGITSLIRADYRIITKIYEINNKNLIDKQFVKYFDYDKIKDGLCFRNRRDGDYMYPKGMNGSKKLKDIFIDKKIPGEIRQQIPLIASDNEVLWVLNMRDTRNYKLSDATKHVLEIKVEGGLING